MNIIFRLHSLYRMVERKISEEEILEVVQSGKVIKDYPDDKPYPSKLMYKFIDSRPIHVVVAENKDEDELIIITVYLPDTDIWDINFERRK